MADDQTEAWVEVGRSRLRYEFEHLAAEFHTAFIQAAAAIAAEREITGRDVERLDDLLQDADTLVDELAKVPEEYVRPPKLEELVTDEVTQQLIERSPFYKSR